MQGMIIGSFVVDLMARTPHLPEPGETVKGSFFKAGAGGKGFNQAVAAKRVGCSIEFSTKLGKDNFSQFAFEAMKMDHMDTKFVFVDEKSSTGTALISVDEATSQNEIVVVLGACDTFSDADIEALKPAIDACDFLLLQLEINIDAVEKIIHYAYSKSKKIILNPAPVQPIAPELYKKLYLITPNEVEAKILTGINCNHAEDYDNIANAFFEMGVENVILTLGEKGVYINNKVESKRIPITKVAVKDTSGAGDAFNGGLLAGLCNGKNLFDASVYANAVSNLSVTKLGTSVAMPTKEDVENFIAHH